MKRCVNRACCWSLVVSLGLAVMPTLAAEPAQSLAGSSKEFVAGLQNDAAQTDRIVFLRRKEIADGLGGGARVVAAERRVHPVFREEDVAGALNIAKHSQRRSDVFFRTGSTQRMMNVSQSLDDPGFVTAILHIG